MCRKLSRVQRCALQPVHKASVDLFVFICVYIVFLYCIVVGVFFRVNFYEFIFVCFDFSHAFDYLSFFKGASDFHVIFLVIW